MGTSRVETSATVTGTRAACALAGACEASSGGVPSKTKVAPSTRAAMPNSQASLDRSRPVPISGSSGDSRSWSGLVLSPEGAAWTLWSMTNNSGAWSEDPGSSARSRV